MASDIDQLCINTIRTLSMDAIQKANSGHPGTPMALAPVAYTLWQRFLRFDPADPIWPNRDRFVLSAGHASMLLYSLLHLDRGAGGRPRLRGRRQAVGLPRATSKASASSTRVRRAIPSTAGPRAWRRPPARSARASPPRSAWRSPRKWQGARYGADALRLRRLRDRRRRLPDGGRLQRGRLDRRPPQARQSLLDLRQQPHHDRRQDEARLRGRRRRPLHGLRLERHPGRRCQRHGSADTRLRGVQGRGGSADADHRRQPHRLGLAPQAGHRRRPRRAARRGGGARDQARLRLARGRPVPRPRRASGSTSPAGVGSRGAELQRRLEGTARRLRRERSPELAAEIDAMQRRELPAGWDAGIPSFEPDERGTRHPQGLEQGRERDRRAPALAARRLRRPHRLDLGPARLRRRRRLRARRLRRAPAPLRHPRARGGGDLQRPLAVQAAAAAGRPTSPSPTTRGRRSGSRR